VGNLELDAARGIGFDEIDETPWDGAEGNPLQQDLKSRTGRKSAEKAPDGAAGADIDGSNAQGVMKLTSLGDGIDLEFDVVDAHDLAAVNVDDLLIEKIAFEKEQALRTVGSGPVSRIGGSMNVGVDRGDGRGRENAITGFGFNNERGDAGPVFLRGERGLAHAAGRRAGWVVHGCAQELGKSQCVHPGRG
jgi:hypothetical protein